VGACWGALGLAAAAEAQALRFVPHDLNPAAEFPACAVLDVNRDGRLDIASGGFWYEAPHWQRHFLREVEIIRGRYDDYSNLELDVNGDGWTDLVSVNYRSRSLYWLENPGPALQHNPDTPWTKHVIDTPGPMETGRLVDIDGDGQVDILPNGVTFAAWYELVRQPGEDGKLRPRFLRHDVPSELAGHGVGFGDVDGDGRGDLVGPHGWLQAPQDRRGGRWVWHPQWHLPPDASVPILVFDVDGDGDSDLVFGRGHRYGLYWLQQGRSSRGEPTWTLHAIDTSWAQAHSIFLADLTGDGRPELVAGKRYMGHEGRDPGEYDLLGAYYYQWQPATQTWRRFPIYEGHRCGFGLDPKAADLDGDGDLDLVAADRCGLCLLENRGPGDPAPPPAPLQAAYDPRQPIQVAEHDTLRPARTPAEWAWRRVHIQNAMQQVMGPLPGPERRIPLAIVVESREQTPDYVRIKLRYTADVGDEVPALLLVPHSVALEEGSLRGQVVASQPAARRARLPAMLCLHPTNPDGKAQTAGLVGPPTRHYGHELAVRGYVCLIPDYPSFGDYKGYDFRRPAPGSDQPLYASGSMKAIWNNIRAIDVLESLDWIDPDRIGAIGHSLGGHNALFTAVFEPRLAVVVTSCGFTAFHDYYRGDLRGWTSDRYMPRIRDWFSNSPDRMPFDFPEVLAAIAPRPIYINAPLHDSNFDVGGVRKCVAAAKPVYALWGAEEALAVEYPDCEHDFPDEVRQRVYAWLDRQLRPAAER
jgi:predicted dienelactone hydrolase